MDNLIREAQGDSVTKDKLTGDAKYYPDVSYIFTGDPPLVEEHPQYIILLTSSNAIYKGTPAVSKGEEGVKVKTTESALVVTDESLIASGDQIGSMFGGSGFYQYPYEHIDTVGGINMLGGGSIEITSGGIEYMFDLANKHGDSQNVREAYNYIQSRV